MLTISYFGVQWNNPSGRVWRVFGTGKRKWWNLSVSYILNARNKHKINHLSFTILLLFFRAVLENVLLDVDSSCSSETRSQEQRNDEICRWVKPFTV